MNIKNEKILKKYFQILNETFLLVCNIKEIQQRKNFFKKINFQYTVIYFDIKHIYLYFRYLSRRNFWMKKLFLLIFIN